MMTLNLQQIVRNIVVDTINTVGNATIIVAGKSGVGKSTLINAVFKANMAETGVGMPITKVVREIRKEGVPLTILDTRGFEIGEAARETIRVLDEEVKSRNQDRDPNRHIHICWYCMLEGSRRVEAAEQKFVEMLAANNIPTIAVLTQAYNDQGFRNEVLQLLPSVRNAIPVVAEPIMLDGLGVTVPTKGLEKLLDLTFELMPEAHQVALLAASRIGRNLKMQRSQRVIAAAAVSTGGISAVPVPGVELSIIPVQITMMATMSAIWGLPVNHIFLATLLGSSASSLSHLIGRLAVGELVKLIPSVSVIGGAAISAGTAAALTTILGNAYMRALDTVIGDGNGHDVSAEEVRRQFEFELKRALQSEKA